MTTNGQQELARRNLRTALILALVAAGSLGLFVWQITSR